MPLLPCSFFPVLISPIHPFSSRNPSGVPWSQDPTPFVSSSSCFDACRGSCRTHGGGVSGACAFSSSFFSDPSFMVMIYDGRSILGTQEVCGSSHADGCPLLLLHRKPSSSFVMVVVIPSFTGFLVSVFFSAYIIYIFSFLLAGYGMECSGFMKGERSYPSSQVEWVGRGGGGFH
ncbi:hypothetical protein BHM03_00028147 [Ensete ventricosum]|nr:hypothetical protein BHM03_00028147 [Ensete ventricosum]